MEINYYLNNIADNEIALVLNSSFNKGVELKGDSVKDYLLSVSNVKRVSKVLKMLGLEEDILNKKVTEVTNMEEVLLIVAFQLLKQKFLVLYYLDTLLTLKEKNYLKKVVKKISHEYNIKTLVFTNDIEFCFGLIDKILIIEDKEIKEILNNDFYNLDIYKYITKPDIIDFVTDAKKKNNKLENYIEVSELLKGIYRL